MATSPNYGWLEPDNTDLVKNGALAIRTLGNAIDTTMATMTPKSIVDAKGDLIAASAADTPARLAVGNNGETLVADSSTSTGLRYTAGNPIPNPIINSCFDVWQRGTSIAIGAGSGYVADRWFATGNAATPITVSRQVTGDTTNLPNVQYCARFQRNSGSTATTGVWMYQSLESTNAIPYAGKTVTLSFYARKGANYSPTSSLLNVYLISGTGTDQNYASGYTGAAYPIDNQSVTLTTSWQRFSFTGTVGATATELTSFFAMSPTGTAGANDYYEITGVQIDIGSVALPIRRTGATIQGELAACQRYYWRSYGNAANANWNLGSVVASGYSITPIPNPVEMRVAATSMDFSGVLFYEPIAATNSTADTTSSPDNTTRTSLVRFNKTTLTNVGRVGYLNGGTTNYIGFSAEL
jgi:hypothetical protein